MWLVSQPRDLSLFANVQGILILQSFCSNLIVTVSLIPGKLGDHIMEKAQVKWCLTSTVKHNLMSLSTSAICHIKFQLCNYNYFFSTISKEHIAFSAAWNDCSFKVLSQPDLFPFYNPSPCPRLSFFPLQTCCCDMRRMWFGTVLLK